ncbi:MAG: hypothetical protein F4208_04805, partial [Gemmatimonadales bacterium]|nr:hypothetical protein [Gemmatimonadales bacterium]
MVDADRGLLPEAFSDRSEHAAAVIAERADVVRLLLADGVQAVAAEVVHEEVEAIGEERPERVVAVGGLPVAVAEDHARAVGVAVPADADDGAVGHGRVERGQGLGHLVPVGHGASLLRRADGADGDGEHGHGEGEHDADLAGTIATCEIIWKLSTERRRLPMATPSP